jgi:hypothetical protein
VKLVTFTDAGRSAPGRIDEDEKGRDLQKLHQQRLISTSPDAFTPNRHRHPGGRGHQLRPAALPGPRRHRRMRHHRPGLCAQRRARLSILTGPGPARPGPRPVNL